MRVIVTGGGGFIGAAVCAALEMDGDTPIVFDRTHGHDILSTPIPPAGHVVHLAGVLGTDELFDTPELAVDVNVKGTLRVLKWCVENNAGYTGISMPPVFPSIYTATKVAAVRMAEAYHHAFGVPVSHVRAFNAFGAGQKHGPGHPRKIVPAFATEAWTGKPLVVWGDGNQTVDLIHTSDLARMLVHACAFGKCETFDGGTGYAHTVNDVARGILNIVGAQNWEIDHRPMRRGEQPTNIVAEGEGWDLLGWRPEFRYDDMVETVRSYKP